MQAIETLNHSDECSGITVFDDGKVCLWSEGYGDVDVLDVDGSHTRLPNTRPHEILDAMEEPAENLRPMTNVEEVMFYTIRNISPAMVPKYEG